MLLNLVFPAYAAKISLNLDVQVKIKFIGKDNIPIDLGYNYLLYSVETLAGETIKQNYIYNSIPATGVEHQVSLKAFDNYIIKYNLLGRKFQKIIKIRKENQAIEIKLPQMVTWNINFASKNVDNQDINYNQEICISLKSDEDENFFKFICGTGNTQSQVYPGTYTLNIYSPSGYIEPKTIYNFKIYNNKTSKFYINEVKTLPLTITTNKPLSQDALISVTRLGATDTYIMPAGDNKITIYTKTGPIHLMVTFGNGHVYNRDYYMKGPRIVTLNENIDYQTIQEKKGEYLPVRICSAYQGPKKVSLFRQSAWDSYLWYLTDIAAFETEYETGTPGDKGTTCIETPPLLRGIYKVRLEAANYGWADEKNINTQYADTTPTYVIDKSRNLSPVTVFFSALTVRNVNGVMQETPLSDYNVSVINKATLQKYETTSAQGANLTLPPGLYDTVVTSNGFIPYKKQISVYKTNTYKFYMSKETQYRDINIKLHITKSPDIVIHAAKAKFETIIRDKDPLTNEWTIDSIDSVVATEFQHSGNEWLLQTKIPTNKTLTLKTVVFASAKGTEFQYEKSLKIKVPQQTEPDTALYYNEDTNTWFNAQYNGEKPLFIVPIDIAGRTYRINKIMKDNNERLEGTDVAGNITVALNNINSKTGKYSNFKFNDPNNYWIPDHCYVELAYTISGGTDANKYVKVSQYGTLQFRASDVVRGTKRFTTPISVSSQPSFMAKFACDNDPNYICDIFISYSKSSQSQAHVMLIPELWIIGDAENFNNFNVVEDKFFIKQLGGQWSDTAYNVLSENPSIYDRITVNSDSPLKTQYNMSYSDGLKVLYGNRIVALPSSSSTYEISGSVRIEYNAGPKKKYKTFYFPKQTLKPTSDNDPLILNDEAKLFPSTNGGTAHIRGQINLHSVATQTANKDLDKVRELKVSSGAASLDTSTPCPTTETVCNFVHDAYSITQNPSEIAAGIIDLFRDITGSCCETNADITTCSFTGPEASVTINHYTPAMPPEGEIYDVNEFMRKRKYKFAPPDTASFNCSFPDFSVSGSGSSPNGSMSSPSPLVFNLLKDYKNNIPATVTTKNTPLYPKDLYRPVDNQAFTNRKILNIKVNLVSSSADPFPLFVTLKDVNDNKINYANAYIEISHGGKRLKKKLFAREIKSQYTFQYDFPIEMDKVVDTNNPIYVALYNAVGEFVNSALLSSLNNNSGTVDLYVDKNKLLVQTDTVTLDVTATTDKPEGFKGKKVYVIVEPSNLPTARKITQGISLDSYFWWGGEKKELSIDPSNPQIAKGTIFLQNKKAGDNIKLLFTTSDSDNALIHSVVGEAIKKQVEEYQDKIQWNVNDPYLISKELIAEKALDDIETKGYLKPGDFTWVPKQVTVNGNTIKVNAIIPFLGTSPTEVKQYEFTFNISSNEGFKADLLEVFSIITVLGGGSLISKVGKAKTERLRDMQQVFHKLNDNYMAFKMETKNFLAQRYENMAVEIVDKTTGEILTTSAFTDRYIKYRNILNYIEKLEGFKKLLKNIFAPTELTKQHFTTLLTKMFKGTTGVLKFLSPFGGLSPSGMPTVFIKSSDDSRFATLEAKESSGILDIKSYITNIFNKPLTTKPVTMYVKAKPGRNIIIKILAPGHSPYTEIIKAPDNQFSFTKDITLYRYNQSFSYQNLQTFFETHPLFQEQFEEFLGTPELYPTNSERSSTLIDYMSSALGDLVIALSSDFRLLSPDSCYWYNCSSQSNNE